MYLLVWKSLENDSNPKNEMLLVMLSAKRFHCMKWFCEFFSSSSEWLERSWKLFLGTRT